jgi:hypothetical protein
MIEGSSVLSRSEFSYVGLKHGRGDSDEVPQRGGIENRENIIGT